LELETLKAMKKAGCWLVAYGFESGSEETLIKIRKGATINHNTQPPTEWNGPTSSFNG
jgi:radical SAM superfamily enzyme YgiQ (UPF0313 family)